MQSSRSSCVTGKLTAKLAAAQYDVDYISNIFESDEHAASAASWRPSPKINGIRNEGNVLIVMQHVKDDLIRRATVTTPNASAALQVFLVGDCSMVPAIVCALQHNSPSSKIGIIYLDGDCHLSLPGDSHENGRSGILDSVAMSHYTQRPGCLDSIKNAFAQPDGKPLVEASNIVLFGQEAAAKPLSKQLPICCLVV